MRNPVKKINVALGALRATVTTLREAAAEAHRQRLDLEVQATTLTAAAVAADGAADRISEMIGDNA